MRKVKWSLGVVIIAVFCAMLALGVGFYLAVERNSMNEATARLLAIAGLKTDEIVRWRGERMGDASVLTESPYLSGKVEQWLRNPQPEEEAQLRVRLGSLQTHYHYFDVLIVDVKGQILSSLTNRQGAVTAEIMPVLADALAEKSPKMTDLHYMPDGNLPHIDVIAPMIGANGEAFAAIVLQSDAREFLYPFLQSWPSATQSGETVLVRRDEDSVLFLNELRFQKDTALKLRIPLTRTDVPAVMAAMGREGIVDGLDYRGAPVLSALARIPDSPWFIVAKVDRAEALAVWRTTSTLILVGVVGLLACAFFLLVAHLQRQSSQRYKALYLSESQRFENEERYAKTIMGIGDGVIATDASGCVQLINPVAESLTGWPQDEARGKPLQEVFRIINEETRGTVEDPAAKVLERGIVVGLANHTLLISRDGTECPIADSGAPIRNEKGEITGVVLVFRDVRSERRHEREQQAAHEALQESEERHRVLFMSSRDAIMTLEPPEWRFTSANAACIEMFGVKDEAAFTSLGPWEVSPEHQPDGVASADKARSMIEKAMTEGSNSFEWQHKRWEGDPFPATVLLTRVLLENKTFLQATVRDISHDKRAEAALRSSEEKYRHMVENIGLGVALISADMRIMELNRQMREWFPHVRVEERPVCHLTFNDPPTEEPCSYCPVVKTLQDGEVHESITQAQDKTGGRTFRIVSSPIHDNQGRVAGAIEMVEDVTERMRMERELGQAQKLEAVGRLAAGIAHEINTPTQYIGDNIEFLQIAHKALVDNVTAFRKMVEAAPHGEIGPALLAEARELIDRSDLDYLTEQVPRAIEQSLEGVGRVSTIVQAMKEFSHPGTTEKTTANLNQCIRSTVTVSKNEWKYVADLELDLDETLPPVVCLPAEVNQVFLNLIVNAAHAIGDVLGKSPETKGKIAVATRTAGDHVEIHISDTGGGIPEAIRNRVFDPFFTTKNVGRGTGQGLTIARSVIVDKHGGTIDFSSDVGIGTTFVVRLPIGREEEIDELSA